VHEIVTYRRASDFLDRAGSWLLEKEAENNLILGVAAQIASSKADRHEHLFLTVEYEKSIVGCAFRTPPWKLFITDCPVDAIQGLVDVVLQRYPDLSAVLGPKQSARAFAVAWARRFGSTFRPSLRQRIYELRSVIPPDPPVRGAFRIAEGQDAERLAAWITDFYREVGFPLDDPEGSATRFIQNAEAWFWCDPEPVSVAVYTGHTPRGVRIGLVFTPREMRGLGYASGLTAAMAQHALDNGKESCFLYTDLDNPTSNKIYTGIGFTPVSDVVDYVFEP
jgi:predicted GNAT family acetyltransferase